MPSSRQELCPTLRTSDRRRERRKQFCFPFQIWPNRAEPVTVVFAAYFTGSIMNLESQKILPIDFLGAAKAIEKHKQANSVGAIIHQVGRHHK